MNEVQVTYKSRNNIQRYANCKIIKNIYIFKYCSTLNTCKLPVFPDVLPIKQVGVSFLFYSSITLQV